MSLYYEDCREDAGSRNAFPFDPVQTAEAVIGAVLESEHCPYAADVSLMLVTDDEIRTMNKETRNIDKATDVLSFPMFAYTVPAAFSETEAHKADAFDRRAAISFWATSSSPRTAWRPRLRSTGTP